MKFKKVIGALKGGVKRDEEIAEKCGMDIRDVRRILNELLVRCAVVYEKKFDERSGWHSFFWKLKE